MKLILTAHVHSYNHTIIFERFPFNEFIENKINLTYNLHKLIIISITTYHSFKGIRKKFKETIPKYELWVT